MNDKNTTTESFVHMVFFWLKNPTDKNDRTNFEKAMNTFIETSKYAKSKHFGIPAKTDRPVVDNSYTYCLKVSFDNIEEHDKYQVEPAHKLFISEASKL